jgi:hypothetical protein
MDGGKFACRLIVPPVLLNEKLLLSAFRGGIIREPQEISATWACRFVNPQPRFDSLQGANGDQERAPAVLSDCVRATLSGSFK